MAMIPISQMFRSRVAQVLALGGVITTGACKDVTAPEQVETAEMPALALARSAVVDELGEAAGRILTFRTIQDVICVKSRIRFTSLKELYNIIQTGMITHCIKVLYPADYILNKYFKGNTTIPKLNWTDSYARRFSMSNTLFLYMQMLHLDIYMDHCRIHLHGLL